MFEEIDEAMKTKRQCVDTDPAKLQSMLHQMKASLGLNLDDTSPRKVQYESCTAIKEAGA